MSARNTGKTWRDRFIAGIQKAGKAPTKVRLATQNVLHGGEVLIVGITEFANVTERFVADMRKANEVLTAAIGAGHGEYHEQFNEDGKDGKPAATAEFSFTHTQEAAAVLEDVLKNTPEQFGEALKAAFEQIMAETLAKHAKDLEAIEEQMDLVAPLDGFWIETFETATKNNHALWGPFATNEEVNERIERPFARWCSYEGYSWNTYSYPANQAEVKEALSTSATLRNPDEYDDQDASLGFGK